MKHFRNWLVLGCLAIVLFVGAAILRWDHVVIHIIAKNSPGGSAGLSRGKRVTIPKGNSSTLHVFKLEADDHFVFTCVGDAPGPKGVGYFTPGSMNDAEVIVDGCAIVSYKE